MKREEELTVSVKPLTWEHDGSRYHAYCRITDTRYVANNEGEKREREAGRAARILSALLSNPKSEAEPVGYADLGHIARKESAGSSVYPFPTGTCRSPLYAHPPNPEETDDWFSQIASFFVKHGMLDERDQYDISDIMAALADNYEPEATEGKNARMLELYADSYARMSRMGDGMVSASDVAYDIRQNMIKQLATEATEGVDRHVHHSNPVVSQNTQIVEDKATEVQAAERSCTCHPDDNPPIPCARKFAYSECEGGAHEKGIEAASKALGHEGVYISDATLKRAIDAYRTALTAKQSDGRVE